MTKWALVVAYLGSIVLGVWAIDLFGVVPVAPGIMAPAAVYVVGATLVLRDLVHVWAGRRVAFFAVLIGALLSALVSPQLALASGVAFLVSETLDLIVFDKVRRKWGSIPLAIIVSNAVSLVIDSFVFLGIAFGSYEFLTGQIIGKAVATAVAVAIVSVLLPKREVAV